MRKRQLLLIPILASGAAGGWWCREPLAGLWRTTTGGAELVLREKLQPDPKTYAVLTKDLERWRKDLAARHQKAKSATARTAVEADARAVLEQALPAMMRCWLGTPWNFNGTAKGPGAGKIACGYFVATVLKDAGFRVDRYQLAQQASENILRSFLPKESCDLSVGKDYQAFASDAEKREPGVYLVGLDTHVAFLVVGDEGFRFIHSSGSQPWCVVEENRADAGVLQRSKWRMLGNLTADPGALRRWLKAEKIVVRGA
ncbi:MAG: hypothetical protein RLZZ214_3621 [Verrucomicrobiota bacterium]|jgi:hypothetical protein